MDGIKEKVMDILSSGRGRLCTDSRVLQKGDVFIAIRGYSVDGHDFVGSAVNKGASLAVCENGVDVPPGISTDKVLFVPDTRTFLADSAREVFGDPSSKMSTFGVTGTNGKSTTVFLLEGILSLGGIPCGMISTVFNKTKGQTPSKSEMTTPDVIELNGMLKDMLLDGKKAAAIEISSHALHQKRVSGILLDAAIFTNITPEHLDYHKDMASYLSAKVSIFNNLKKDGIAVINGDDPLLKGLPGSLKAPRTISFGMSEDADISCADVSFSLRRTEFDLLFKGVKKARISSPLVGKHNLYNVLAACSALYFKGFDPETIRRGLEVTPPVPGRLEPVLSDAPFDVFVDYAHTPDALANVLDCLKTFASGGLVCVFGCGGDRDRNKRPLMGSIASKLCSRVILTSDNPRGEDPLDIIKEIENGVPADTDYCIMIDRREAITEALKQAGKGDIVLVSGKGHEDTQIVGRKRTAFSDKDVISDTLREMGFL